MERVILQLARWDEGCSDHLGVVGDLPRLRARVRSQDGTDNWVAMYMHWTGRGWQRCRPPWDERAEIEAWAEEAVREANATSPDSWLVDYRCHLAQVLGQTQATVERQQRNVAASREEIRQLECRMAAAEIRDPQAYAVAHRLLSDWSGSAQDLIATAEAVAVVPRGESGATSGGPSGGRRRRVLVRAATGPSRAAHRLSKEVELLRQHGTASADGPMSNQSGQWTLVCDA
jgi:hypothetical protein